VSARKARWGHDLGDRVGDVLRETSAEVIEPRFAALGPMDVRSKAAGELVTVADVEAERLLTRRLTDLLPGAAVVGEEACAADPTLLKGLGAAQAWLIDPLDGTANFVEGNHDWAVMVALCEGGRTVASWIWQPRFQTMYTAEAGSGAARNGVTVAVTSRPVEPGALRGAVLTRFLPTSVSATVDAGRDRFDTVTAGRRCAGVDYPAVVDCGQDFVLFWRTLPWDHAPGVLLLQEAGGVALRPDANPYCPADTRPGLLVTADRSTWDAVRAILLPGVLTDRDDGADL
jgi:fructose-1,6-bisphosphatase/inositol monophosphatase family enzyme